MTKHFIHELDVLKGKTLALCAEVEECVFLAVRAASALDTELAKRVIARDDEIDRREVEIEEDCLKLLALYQPVAQDLRFIVSALKLNNDLERIGDLAVNIAHRAVMLHQLPRVTIALDLGEMAERTKLMLRRSLDALVQLDSKLAREVLASDDQIDNFNREAHKVIEAAIRKDSSNVETYLCLLGVSRNLERIADHATNIAEDVLYLVQGEIVRHGRVLSH